MKQLDLLFQSEKPKRKPEKKPEKFKEKIEIKRAVNSGIPKCYGNESDEKKCLYCEYLLPCMADTHDIPHLKKGKK
jgi:hypothetical protein